MAPFRSYDPAIGRWIQVDPLTEFASGWTPYRFGFNNPISYVDPLGLIESEGTSTKKSRNSKKVKRHNDRVRRKRARKARREERREARKNRKANNNRIDLGEYGHIVVTNPGEEKNPGDEWRYTIPTRLAVEMRYYPGENEDPFNFVQTVHSNLSNAEMHKIDSGNRDNIQLGDHWSADGFNDEGTFFTKDELDFEQYQDDFGNTYYQFSDWPGRVSVKGAKIFWDAEFSVVTNSNGTNNRCYVNKQAFFVKK